MVVESLTTLRFWQAGVLNWPRTTLVSPCSTRGGGSIPLGAPSSCWVHWWPVGPRCWHCPNYPSCLCSPCFTIPDRVVLVLIQQTLVWSVFVRVPCDDFTDRQTDRHTQPLPFSPSQWQYTNATKISRH